jgi:hypothetical protein
LMASPVFSGAKRGKTILRSIRQKPKTIYIAQF